MKIVVLLISCLVFQSYFAQDLEPYNEEFQFEVVEGDEVVVHDDSLKALVIDTGNSLKAIEASLRNNPQLQEVKFRSASQEVLDVLGSLRMDSLFFVAVENYTGTTLNFPPVKSLEFLQINAETLKSLDMSKSQLTRLEILVLEVPLLTSWKSELTYPELTELDIDAPILTLFPMHQMPKINEFTYSCALKELPKNLCAYKDLEIISFENHCPVKVDKCLIAMVEKGVYSNITVYDKPDGKILLDINSKDK